MSDVVVKKKPRYSVLCGKTYLSFNGSYKFPYDMAEELMDDYRRKLKKNLDKEVNEEKRKETVFLIDSLKLVIYTEH